MIDVVNDALRIEPDLAAWMPESSLGVLAIEAF
jgi:hypothetical protein